jgi:transketolase
MAATFPFGATFLTFSDYSRNALRMAALMKLRTIFVFTHDSIGLGEDGPTHQSVEHVSSLRLIPNLDNWRPCDTVESAVAWGASGAAQGRPVDPDLLAPEPAVPGTQPSRSPTSRAAAMCCRMRRTPKPS